MGPQARLLKLLLAGGNDRPRTKSCCSSLKQKDRRVRCGTSALFLAGSNLEEEETEPCPRRAVLPSTWRLRTLMVLVWFTACQGRMKEFLVVERVGGRGQLA